MSKAEWSISLAALAFMVGLPGYIASNPDLIGASSVITYILVIPSGLAFILLCFFANDMAIISAMNLYRKTASPSPFFIRSFYAQIEMSKPATLCSAALAYAVTIYAFALVYKLLSWVDLDSFKDRIEDLGTAVYFSIVTMATVGYGDVVPKTGIAKALVSAEILLGVGYSIFFFSILSSFMRERQHE